MLATRLAACEGNILAWYEQRCVRAGLAKGTPAYDQCVQRELSYLEENRRIDHPGARAGLASFQLPGRQSLRDKSR